jgi:hypothetical protein
LAIGKGNLFIPVCHLAFYSDTEFNKRRIFLSSRDLSNYLVFDDLRVRVNGLAQFAAGSVFIGRTKHFGSALNHNRRSIYSAFYVRQYFRLHSA